jgi:hypothetical protein
MPPQILTLKNLEHARRFNLDQWERDRILSHCFPNRWDGINHVQGRIEVLVGHIQAGITWGSLDWRANGRDKNGNRIQASSNIMTQQDGTLLEVIDPKHGPWTNGDTQSPTTKSLEVRMRGGNPNVWSWTCEAEGQPWSTFTPEHWETILWAFDDQLKKHPHLDPTKDIIGHRDLNSVSRANCGLYVPRLIAELAGDHRPKDTKGTTHTYSSPIPVIVNVPAGLNIRQWGEVDQPIIGFAPVGSVIMVRGHVIGDEVQGIREWYIDGKGRRLWSGGTNRPNF